MLKRQKESKAFWVFLLWILSIPFFLNSDLAAQNDDPENFIVTEDAATTEDQPADAVADVIYGVVEAIVTRKGVPINQANAAEIDGTYSNSTATYTAAADNQTVAFFHADVRPLKPGMVMSGELDAAAATTTGSNIPGYYISVLTTDSTKLDESTAHATNVLHMVLTDNGQGNNSAQDPVKEGNHVLLQVIEADVPRAAQA